MGIVWEVNWHWREGISRGEAVVWEVTSWLPYMGRPGSLSANRCYVSANRCYAGIIRPQILVASFSSDKVGNWDSGRKGLIFPVANIPENPSHKAPQLWASAWSGPVTSAEPPDLRLLYWSWPSPSISVWSEFHSIPLPPGKWATGWDRIKRKETGGQRAGAPNNKSNNNPQILSLPSAGHAVKCFLHITSCSMTAPCGRNLRDWEI